MAKPAPITEAEVIEKITEAGYTSLANLQQKGKTWHCTAANSSGAPVELVVNPHGKINEKQDDDEEDTEEEI